MKIEVMVDKDNTHFSYKFDCDKVIDGTNNSASSDNKLVILKKNEKKERETIAVFNVWTFWRIIDNGDVIGYYQTLSGRIPLTQKILDKNPQMVRDEKCFIGPQYVDNLKQNV